MASTNTLSAIYQVLEQIASGFKSSIICGRTFQTFTVSKFIKICPKFDLLINCVVVGFNSSLWQIWMDGSIDRQMGGWVNKCKVGTNMCFPQLSSTEEPSPMEWFVIRCLLFHTSDLSGTVCIYLHLVLTFSPKDGSAAHYQWYH